MELECKYMYLRIRKVHGSTIIWVERFMTYLFCLIKEKSLLFMDMMKCTASK